MMPKGNDLTGRRFGKLLVVERLEERGERYYLYRCRCDCGNEILVNTKRLLRGTIQGCEQCWKVRSNKPTDHTGKRYGALVALHPSSNRKRDRYTWVCQCDCGSITEVTAHDLVSGASTSCGCKKTEWARNKFRDLQGQRIGMLQVIERTGDTDSKGSLLWRCKCECGNECIYSADRLLHGNTVSCGCYRRNELPKLLPTRMHFIDGTCVEFLKRRMRSDNTSGYIGVYHIKNGKWRASIGFKGKTYYLGTFIELSEAVAARKEAESIHTDFLEWYERNYSSKKPVSEQTAKEASLIMKPHAAGVGKWKDRSESHRSLNIGNRTHDTMSWGMKGEEV